MQFSCQKGKSVVKNKSNMKAIFLSLLALVCWVGAPTASAQATPATPAPSKPALLTPDQEKARNLVEMVYNTWRLGVMRADETAWRSSTSTSRQMRVRNLIISERGNFPRDFFASARQAPQLENFRYVGTLGGCGGRTLAATYIGKMQLGNNEAHDNAYVLLLVKEGNKWKLDQTRFFDLSRLPNVLKRLQSRDLSVLHEQDGFHPYAALPTVPPACRAPELIGKIFVDCPGRAIDMRINGVSLHEFDDERRADVISGGLHRGANTITYTIRNSATGQDHPQMGIGIFVMPETPGNHPVCVFDHVLDASDKAEGGTFTFTISPDHIASMNPKFQGTPPQPFHAVPLKAKPTNAKP